LLFIQPNEVAPPTWRGKRKLFQGRGNILQSFWPDNKGRAEAIIFGPTMKVPIALAFGILILLLRAGSIRRADGGAGGGALQL